MLINHSLMLFGSQGVLVSFSQDKEGKENPISHVETDEGKQVFHFQNGNTLTITLSEKGELAKLSTKWRFEEEGEYRLYAITRLPHGQENCEVFIPAIWYQGNRQGKGQFPSEAKSKSFSFLETRSSLPCAIVLEGSQNVLCQCVSPAKSEPLASISWRGECAITTIPGAEWPYSYKGKQKLVDTQSNPKPRWHFGKGEEYTRSWTIMLMPNKGVLAGWEHFVRLLEVKPLFTPTISWETYGATKLAHLLSLVRFENGEPYMIMGTGNGEEQSVYEYTAGAFLVRGVEAAVTFASTPPHLAEEPHVREKLRILMQPLGAKTEKEVLPLLGLKMGRFYLHAEQAPGVWQDCHDIKRGLWGGYLGIGEHPEYKMMVNSRTAGVAMKQYLALYDALKPFGIEEKKFLDVTERVAAFFCDYQIADGSFGRWWTVKGMPVNTKGTNGAYVATFLCALISRHDDEGLKGHLLLALEHYGRLVDDGAFYADTLDADSCDKEAGLALLDLMLSAWKLFKDQRYLAWAKKSASFVLSWIWQDDGWLDPSSPLGKRHFHTQGMTGVSVANQHLDFFCLLVALLFERLAKASGDSFWHQQAVLMENAARQLIGTEKDMLGRDESYYGWQPEQINHTDWDYFNKDENTRGSFTIDIAWVSVLGYGAWLTLQKEGYTPCNESV